MCHAPLSRGLEPGAEKTKVLKVDLGGLHWAGLVLLRVNVRVFCFCLVFNGSLG